MQCDQNNVYDYGSDHGLQDTDNNSRTAHSLQLAQTELIANGECDKAQCDLGHKADTLDLFQRVKAQSGQTNGTQAEGTKDQTCKQISGYRRQVQ